MLIAKVVSLSAEGLNLLTIGLNCGLNWLLSVTFQEDFEGSESFTDGRIVVPFACRTTDCSDHIAFVMIGFAYRIALMITDREIAFASRLARLITDREIGFASRLARLITDRDFASRLARLITDRDFASRLGLLMTERDFASPFAALR